MSSVPHNSPRKIANAIRTCIAKEFRDMSLNKHEPTYSDIANIAAMVEDFFPEGIPEQIAGALTMAKGMMHPKQMDSARMLHEGASVILASGGGMALLWGILQVLAYGVVLTTTTGWLWWKTTVVTTLFGGPIGIMTGVGMIAVGLYWFSSRSPARERAETAQRMIEKSIDSWKCTQ